MMDGVTFFDDLKFIGFGFHCKWMFGGEYIYIYIAYGTTISYLTMQLAYYSIFSCPVVPLKKSRILLVSSIVSSK